MLIILCVTILIHHGYKKIPSSSFKPPLSHHCNFRNFCVVQQRFQEEQRAKRGIKLVDLNSMLLFGRENKGKALIMRRHYTETVGYILCQSMLDSPQKNAFFIWNDMRKSFSVK